MLSSETEEAGIGERRPGVAEDEVPAAVALSSQRDDRVRPRPHLPVGPPVDVNAEEREARVGHRVDQVPAQAGGVRLQREVVTPEGDDPRLGSRAAGESVGTDACADDRKLRLDEAVARLDADGLGAFVDTQHGRSGRDPATVSFDAPCERRRDGAKVDQPRAGNVERVLARAVGLELPQAGAVDPLELHAVRRAPPLELRERRPLVVLDRDDDLPAELVRDALLVAEREEELASLAAELRLERARGVVEIGRAHV